jgi:TRAP-type C4-dicarboxylate transport system permease small subunit
MKLEKRDLDEEKKGYLLLWVGVLMAPIVWLTQFEIRYSLVQWACARQNRLVLHLLSAVVLILIASGGFLSWRNWVREGKRSPTDEISGPQERNLFLALLGALVSAMFALVLTAQFIAEILIDPCWQ